jgi:ABC-2 type transport system ATP-binding protein
MPDPAIRTEGLTKRYGDFTALVDLNLEIRRGEIFGFLGPNGAGKTTAIRTLLDEIRPSAGRAEILGLDSHRNSVEIRRHVGYLPGDLAMYPNLTGRDTLRYFANLRGGVDWEFVEQLADRFTATLDKKIGELSSGNRQKIGLIQAFMSRPEVLIMDEPSSGLDPLVQQEFQHALREVAAEGRTVFLLSHTLSEVQRAADRIGIIRRGKLIAVEEVASLRSKAVRHVVLHLDSDAGGEGDFAAVSGVRDVKIDAKVVTLSIDGPMAPLLKMVSERFAIVDMSVEEADLEDIFLTFYRDESAAA